ncbi:hypothetical protein DPMN_060983, partial [Dreissena polymorpha]
GKFAVVKKCINKTSGEVLAAKYIKKRRRGKSCREEILREVVMLEMALDHPRLVNLKEVYETPQELILITEYCAGGELFTECILEEKFNEADVRLLMSQILEGLVYLHEKNIVHLDLKPQNILLTEEFPRGTVKICDLGFACMVNTGEDIRDIIGTPDYVAPEVLNYDTLGLYTDMWSLGVLTYVMLTTCSPFAADDKNETFANITNVHLDFPEDLFADISPAAQDFIQKLLIAEPSERMTAKECQSHEWLYDIFHPSIKESPEIGDIHQVHANAISDGEKIENGDIDEDMSGSVSENAREENVSKDGTGDVAISDCRGKIKVQLSGMSEGDSGIARSDSIVRIRNQVSEMSVTEGGEDIINELEYSEVFDDRNIRPSDTEFAPSVEAIREHDNANCSRLQDNQRLVGTNVGSVERGLEVNEGNQQNAFADISPNTDSTVSLSECKSYEFDSGIGTCSDSMVESDETEVILQENNQGSFGLGKSAEQKHPNDYANLVSNGPEDDITENEQDDDTKMELDQASEEINVANTFDIHSSTNNNAIDAQSNAKRDITLLDNIRKEQVVMKKSPVSFGVVQTSPLMQTRGMPRISHCNLDDSINSTQLAGERQKRVMCNENKTTVSGSNESKDAEEYEFISVSKRVKSIETAITTPRSPQFSPKTQRSPRIARHSRSYSHQHH